MRLHLEQVNGALLARTRLGRGRAASRWLGLATRARAEHVYSRPLVLSSSATYPAARARAVELHTSADSLTYAAGVTDAFQRHSSAPAASAPAEKPLPSTVTGVPPSAAPRVGESDDTAAAGWYVKRTPLDENC